MGYHWYRVYGLNVKSEVYMPELISIPKDSPVLDIDISLGKVDDDIYKWIDKNAHGQFNKDRKWFHIKDVGTYLIKDNKVIIEKHNECTNNNLKSFLLGSAMGLSMIQKNRVVIHGGSVEVNGRAIIITGDTGAGKSTLVSKFKVLGYGVLADDVSAINIDENKRVMVQPGYPQQKLCKDAMKILNYNLNNFKIVDEDREKYVVPIKNEFIKTECNLCSIFEIEENDVESVEISRISGVEKLKTILRNIYRKEVFDYIDMQPEYFKKCLELVNSVEVYKIKRPREKYTVQDQADSILKLLI